MEATPRSTVRIVHSSLDVKSWVRSPPSCDAVRPAVCPACGAASRECGKPLTVIGHGFRTRNIEGPEEPGTKPLDTEVRCRRYKCTRCGAVLQVVPRGVGRALRYSLSAVAHALALWACARMPQAEVRHAISTASARGLASPKQWSSLRRWTLRASVFFGATISWAAMTLRERATEVAAWLASHAPTPTTHVPTDAFFGALLLRA